MVDPLIHACFFRNEFLVAHFADLPLVAMFGHQPIRHASTERNSFAVPFDRSGHLPQHLHRRRTWRRKSRPHLCRCQVAMLEDRLKSRRMKLFNCFSSVHANAAQIREIRVIRKVSGQRASVMLVPCSDITRYKMLNRFAIRLSSRRSALSQCSCSRQQNQNQGSHLTHPFAHSELSERVESTTTPARSAPLMLALVGCCPSPARVVSDSVENQ